MSATCPRTSVPAVLASDPAGRGAQRAGLGRRWARWGGLLALLWLVVGCIEDPRARREFERADGGGGDAQVAQDAAGGEGGAPSDAVDLPDAEGVDAADAGGAFDAIVLDVSVPSDLGLDAGPDAAFDRGVDAEVGDAAPDASALDVLFPVDLGVDDAEVVDAGGFDAAADLGDEDAGPDLGADQGADLGADAEAPLAIFVVGEAEAADERAPVRVRGAAAVAVTGPDGRFRLGPLPAGRLALVFSAEGHQSETVVVELPAVAGEVALGEAVRLYRGTRVAPEPGATGLVWRFDEGWLLWNAADVLFGTPLPALAPRTLVARNHEVLLSFSPDGTAVAARRRTQPGLAGDIDLVPLAGGAPVPLFVEAQPWVRWQGDQVMAMVQTRDALSRLEVVRPGAAPRPVSTGVPWLLVTDLADGRVAFAAGAPPAFEVFTVDLTAPVLAPVQVSAAGGGTTDAWLGNSPGRAGLLWIDDFDVLWRFEPETGPEPLADGVLANPRPRFLADGRLLFWRAGAVAEDLWLLSADAERRLVRDTRGSTYVSVGDGFFVNAAGRGIWHGDFGPAGAEGEVGRLAVAGAQTSFVVVSGGIVALADGAAWRYSVGGAAEALGPTGLGGLQAATGGATAFAGLTGTLWWLPGPGEARPATALAVGAPEQSRVATRDRTGLYHPTADGWVRTDLPPAAAPVVRRYDPPVRALTELLPGERFASIEPAGERPLFVVEALTGARVRWAWGVQQFRVGPRGTHAAYVCDRGVFVVPVP